MSHRNIRRILIANRGEIAMRIIRAARELNIHTIAIYSTADQRSPHMRFADESRCLTSSDPGSAYMDIDHIITEAVKTKADAIHPGYGFLSENPDFAEAVEKKGLIFIGPTSDTIRNMGDKLVAKKIARENGVPVIPGNDQPVEDVREATRIAEKTGYPVLIKASAGGGGKGMRIVNRASELTENIQRARSEALNAFGDGRIFIEKYIRNPRHIEIQVMADRFGNFLHLFERDCSIQRRHQKLVEESPSPGIKPDIRQKLVDSAIKISKACNYRGVGTVEFIVDGQMNHYFLEMNTRLQVEHPVTEEVTGIDLVRKQIEIAAGKRLETKQADIHQKGHAIEFRIYAENPINNFFPSSGKLDFYRPPHGPGIRVDDGYEEGMVIPVYYDSLIAKLIVRAADREKALNRLRGAFSEYAIGRMPTTLLFGRWLVRQPEFLSGNYDTDFINEHFDHKSFIQTSPEDDLIASAMAGLLQEKRLSGKIHTPEKRIIKSKWKKRSD